MFRKWVLILPMLVVRWLALRSCMRIQIGSYEYAQALEDVYFRVPEDRSELHKQIIERVLESAETQARHSSDYAAMDRVKQARLSLERLK